MASIHCKACGTLYRYDKEGCCPNCGAYNRPPKRGRVTADGSVQRMSDADYEKREHARGKVCFERKESHENKVCYEEQARPKATSGTYQSGGSAPRPTGPVPHSKFAPTEYKEIQQLQMEAKKQSRSALRKSTGPAGCIIAFVAMAIILGAMIVIASIAFSIIGRF